METQQQRYFPLPTLFIQLNTNNHEYPYTTHHRNAYIRCPRSNFHCGNFGRSYKRNDEQGQCCVSHLRSPNGPAICFPVIDVQFDPSGSMVYFSDSLIMKYLQYMPGEMYFHVRDNHLNLSLLAHIIFMKLLLLNVLHADAHLAQHNSTILHLIRLLTSSSYSHSPCSFFKI